MIDFVKNYIVLIALILIIVVLGYALFTRLKDFIDIMNNIESEKARIEMLKDKLFRLTELEKKAEEIETQLIHYMVMVPDKPEENMVIEALTNMAQLRKVNMNQMQFGGRKGGEKLMLMPVELDISGRYFDFTAMLNDIYKSYRLMNITKINIKRIDETTGDVVAHLALEVFHKK